MEERRGAFLLQSPATWHSASALGVHPAYSAYHLLYARIPLTAPANDSPFAGGGQMQTTPWEPVFVAEYLTSFTSGSQPNSPWYLTVGLAQQRVISPGPCTRSLVNTVERAAHERLIVLTVLKAARSPG